MFLLHSPGSSDKASLNQQLKLCHENWKFEKQIHHCWSRTDCWHWKGLSLSPTLFKVLLQNPEKPNAAPIQHNLDRNRRPPLSRRLRWDWVDRLRMRGRGGWGTVSHTPWNVWKKMQYGNLTNDQSYIFVSFSYVFFILLSPQWNSMHWLGDPKRTSSGKWWSQMGRKLKRFPTKLHASISMCLSTCLSPRPMVPPDSHPSPPHPELSATRGPDRDHSPVPVWSPHSAASFAQPWASFISDWPIMVTPSYGVTYMH